MSWHPSEDPKEAVYPFFKRALLSPEELEDLLSLALELESHERA